ncbi:hypothetical protein TDB9533_04197 [Thalassocella blandensis]|nr:hypothetical protein TDB9533_04197 [Thalassocella blandensis]
MSVMTKKFPTLSRALGLIAVVSLVYACSGTNTKKVADDVKPTLMPTKQFIPLQEFDKKTGLAVPYEGRENPYTAQKGRIKKESVSAFIEAKRAYKSKQWDRAKSILNALSQNDKSLSGPWMMLGDIAMEQNDIDTAKSHYEQAIKVNKQNINAYLKIAKIQREQGQFIPAQNTYTSALAVWPDYPEAHLNLGVLYDIYLNHPIRAQQHMEAYLFLTGWKDEKVKTWLAEVQSRTGIATTYKLPEENSPAPLTSTGS